VLSRMLYEDLLRDVWLTSDSQSAITVVVKPFLDASTFRPRC
jgi:hypothetical protein